MYAKRSLLFAGIFAVGMLACTTKPPESPLVGASAAPPPMVSWSIPLEPHRMEQPLPMAQACLLSSSRNCMNLDSRPFEPCLVGAKTCDRTAEPMWVTPNIVVSPADLESALRPRR